MYLEQTIKHFKRFKIIALMSKNKQITLHPVPPHEWTHMNQEHY